MGIFGHLALKLESWRESNDVDESRPEVVEDAATGAESHDTNSIEQLSGIVEQDASTIIKGGKGVEDVLARVERDISAPDVTVDVFTRSVRDTIERISDLDGKLNTHLEGFLVTFAEKVLKRVSEVEKIIDDIDSAIHEFKAKMEESTHKQFYRTKLEELKALREANLKTLQIIIAKVRVVLMIRAFIQELQDRKEKEIKETRQRLQEMDEMRQDAVRVQALRQSTLANRNFAVFEMTDDLAMVAPELVEIVRGSIENMAGREALLSGGLSDKSVNSMGDAVFEITEGQRKIVERIEGVTVPELPDYDQDAEVVDDSVLGMVGEVRRLLQVSVKGLEIADQPSESGEANDPEKEDHVARTRFFLADYLGKVMVEKGAFGLTREVVDDLYQEHEKMISSANDLCDDDFKWLLEMAQKANCNELINCVAKNRNVSNELLRIIVDDVLRRLGDISGDAEMILFDILNTCLAHGNWEAHSLVIPDDDPALIMKLLDKDFNYLRYFSNLTVLRFVKKICNGEVEVQDTFVQNFLSVFLLQVDRRKDNDLSLLLQMISDDLLPSNNWNEVEQRFVAYPHVDDEMVRTYVSDYGRPPLVLMALESDREDNNLAAYFFDENAADTGDNCMRAGYWLGNSHRYWGPSADELIDLYKLMYYRSWKVDDVCYRLANIYFGKNEYETAANWIFDGLMKNSHNKDLYNLYIEKRTSFSEYWQRRIAHVAEMC